MNILIENVDAVSKIFDNGFAENVDIGIEGNKISFIRPTGSIPENFKADKIINGRHKLAMPGLVNAHTHCSMTLMRNGANDLPLDKWLFDTIFPMENKMTDEDVYWGTLLGAAEMIKSGTTTMCDMYLHMDYVAKALAESGLRANISRSPVEFHSDSEKPVVDTFDACKDYFKVWNNSSNGRIKVYVEVHSTYLFNNENLRKSAALAKELGTGIHIHLLETAKERKESFDQYGKSPVEICVETGIFDVPVIGAHLVHVSDEDMKTLAARSINAVHNPTSNLKLGSGISPVPEMLSRGINVCLGTDGAASNNNLDMFEEMNLAALIHKGTAQDPLLVNARQAFAMGTENGAKASGFADTGVIKEGMKADIVLLDTDKPHLCPLNDPYSAIVYCAHGSDVDTVIVDGNILMEKRELKNLDEERIMYEVRSASKRMINK